MQINKENYIWSKEKENFSIYILNLYLKLYLIGSKYARDMTKRKRQKSWKWKTELASS